MLQQINNAAPVGKYTKDDLMNKAKMHAPGQHRNAADLLSNVSQSRVGAQPDTGNHKDFSTYDHSNTYVTGPFLKSLKKNSIDDM